MISVSRTLLPPLREYNKYLKRIWKSNWLTNNGELVQELERKLQKYWKIKHVVCVDHGTSALMLAAKALDFKEVAVSPFNFVPTVSSMVWLGIKPIFYDLDEIPIEGPVLNTHIYGEPNLTKARPVL